MHYYFLIDDDDEKLKTYTLIRNRLTKFGFEEIAQRTTMDRYAKGVFINRLTHIESEEQLCKIIEIAIQARKEVQFDFLSKDTKYTAAKLQKKHFPNRIDPTTQKLLDDIKENCKGKIRYWE
jgi:hypothetical protein